MFTASIRSRRSGAAVRLMVLVWVLALMTHLANACVLGRDAAVQLHGHGQIDIAASSGPGFETTGRECHDDATPDHAACNDHCEHAQFTVLKTQAGDALDAAAPLLPTDDRWPVPRARTAIANALATASEPPPSGPPVVILFLRLTI